MSRWRGRLLAVLLAVVTSCSAGAEVGPPPIAPSPDSAAPTTDGLITSAPAATPTPPSVETIAVQVERRSTDAATQNFEQVVLDVLGDDRGWSQAGYAFVAAADATFQIILAEGDEVDRLCLPYDTFGQYSCQNGPVVALNADRWRAATPSWTGSLDDYRIMLINHEVGHLLHLHHPQPQCPGAGWPAPVMMQQSTELGQCTANPWPLPWEILAAQRTIEHLAPPAEHDVSDHRPVPPEQDHGPPS